MCQLCCIIKYFLPFVYRTSTTLTKTVDSRWQYIYNNHHKRRGLFLIINNHTFDPKLNLPQRRGTQNDVKNLQEVFGDILGFEIIVSENLTVSEMMDAFIDGEHYLYN